MKAGDIIGWSGRNGISAFLNLVTWGLPIVGISHVGIMAEHEGRLLHFECTTLADLPCAIQGRPVKGTQAVDLAARLNSYRGRAYHYPLCRDLYDHQSRRLTAWLLDRIGEPYDTKEAIESGGLFGILTEFTHCRRLLCPQAERRSWFCSREVAGAENACGVFDTDDDAKWNPNRLIRHLRRREKILPARRLK